MIKLLRTKKWQKIIKKSNLFDVKFYLFAYPDVRAADIDPVEHYVKFGVLEGNNPSKEFNTAYYLSQYADVQESKINPLVHYILFGEKEGRTCNNVTKKETIKLNDEKIYIENDLSQVYKDVANYMGRHFEAKESLNMNNLMTYVKTIDTTNIHIPNIFDAELYLDLYKDLNVIVS